MSRSNIWLAASDGDLTAVLAFLATDRSLVNAHDENGYTPIHAAASYGHVDLLRTLCKNHGGDANVEDFEGDTPLFVVENVETARVLVEELGAKVGHRNKEGLTAADNIESDGDYPLVAAYLRGLETAVGVNTDPSEANAPLEDTAPPPPPGVDVGISETEDVASQLPLIDEELKKKIEELAQKENFSGEEGQEELRRLVSQAVQEHILGKKDEDGGSSSKRTRQDE